MTLLALAVIVIIGGLVWGFMDGELVAAFTLLLGLFLLILSTH